MVKVDNFRNFNLYKRSIDLTEIAYSAVNASNSRLSTKEANLIRRKAIIISRKIASGLAQTNVLIRFKNLNEAKREILELSRLIIEFINKDKMKNNILSDFQCCCNC